MRFYPILSFLAALSILAGCASPEARRARGGGAGADIGNRTQIVRMHEGADPYHKTPKVIKNQHPSLAGARHADQLSRR